MTVGIDSAPEWTRDEVPGDPKAPPARGNLAYFGNFVKKFVEEKPPVKKFTEEKPPVKKFTDEPPVKKVTEDEKPSVKK